jgi:bacterioferritin-associated ferredoxin
MYVCLCKGVTDKTIRQAVADGVTSMRELRQMYGIGNQCGSCTVCAKDILTAQLQQRQQQFQQLPALAITVCYA